MSSPPRPPSPDRDPALDAAWKAHSTELPSPRVDAAILAAAHREARTRPHAVGDDEQIADARGPSRTWWGIAAAATISAIALGILQSAPPLTSEPSTNVATDMPRDTAERAPPLAALRDAPTTFAEAPRPAAESKAIPDAVVPRREADRRPAPAKADPAPSAAPPTSAPKPSEPRQRRADAPEREAPVASATGTLAEVPAAPTLAPAPREMAGATPTPFPGSASAPSALAAPASPPATPGERAKAEATGNAVDAPRQESRDRVAAASAPPPAARRAQAANDAQRAASAPVAKLQVRTPGVWIERIRALYVERRLADAARELNAFRDAYPDADAQLPVELSAWAATVKRE